MGEGSPELYLALQQGLPGGEAVPQATIDTLADAHRLLYRSKVGLEHAREILRNNGQLCPEVLELLNFVERQQEGKHGRARERRKAA